MTAAALAAVAGPAAASGGGGGCTYSDAGNVQISLWDVDLDGLHDSVTLWVTYGPSFTYEFYTNTTLFYPSMAQANYTSDHGYTDSMVDTSSGATFYLNGTEPNGTYTADVMEDFPGLSCAHFEYTFDLNPLGLYRPSLSAAVTNQTIDQNASATYVVDVANLGNNPDRINLSYVSSEGWAVVLDNESFYLDPGEGTTVNVTVMAAFRAPPLTVDWTTLTAQSGRNGLVADTLALSTHVKPQVFGVALTADNATLSGLVGTYLNFGLHATNTGNNRDTFTFVLPAAPSNWEATPTVPSLTLDAGQSWAFQVIARLPSSYTWTPWWNFSLTLVAGDGLTNASAALHARLLLPDFVVGPSGISLNATAPNPGQAVRVLVTVLNVGAPIAVTFAVSLQDGAGNHTAIVDMTLAGSTIAAFDWTATDGLTGFVAVADSTNSVPEENETNNGATLSVRANMAPAAALANPTATGHPNESIAISALPSTDGDGTVAAYFFAFGDGTDSGWVSTSTVTHMYTNVGNFTVSVRVRDDRGAESAPVAETVSIAPASNGGGGGGGGGGGAGGGAGGSPPDMTMILVIAAVALGAVGALLVLRKRAPKPPQGDGPAQPPASP